MRFTKGQDVCACLRSEYEVSLGQTDPGMRVFRDKMADPEAWSPGDTIKIKSDKFLIFGFENWSVDRSVKAKSSTSGSLLIESSGEGSKEVTITLKEKISSSSYVTVCYRVGLPAIYEVLEKDRDGDAMDIHRATLKDGNQLYLDVYGKRHKKLGAGAVLKAGMLLDGKSIESA